jgi:hypothetical protein
MFNWTHSFSTKTFDKLICLHNLSCSDRTIELRFAHIPPSSSGEQKQAQRHFVHAVAQGRFKSQISTKRK